MRENKWIESSLEDLVKSPISYGVVQTGKATKDGIPCVRVVDLTKSKINKSGMITTTAKIHNSYKRTILQNGDLMIALRGEIGRVKMVGDELVGCNLTRGIARINPKQDIISPHFLLQAMSSTYFLNDLNKRANGSALQEMPISELRKSKVRYPKDIKQQNHIAEIILKWDAAIEKTEELISIKQKRFEWLLYKLIINASRFDKWSSGHLQKLCKIKKGKQLNRSELESSGNYQAWNGGVIPSGYTDIWNTEENTVIISEGGNSCGFVNHVKEKFWCGGHCYSISDLSIKINTEFLYYFLKANEKRIMRLRVGSGLPNIQKKDVDKFDVKYPSIKEQKSISQVLSAAQSEIKLLKELALKYQDQKRGLMQKLLTGKIRINNKRGSK